MYEPQYQQNMDRLETPPIKLCERRLFGTGKRQTTLSVDRSETPPIKLSKCHLLSTGKRQTLSLGRLETPPIKLSDAHLLGTGKRQTLSVDRLKTPPIKLSEARQLGTGKRQTLSVVRLETPPIKLSEGHLLGTGKRKKLSVNRLESPPIKLSEPHLLGTRKRQKLSVDRLETPQIKLSEGHLLGTQPSAQLDTNLQTRGESSRPITRAYSRHKHMLHEQSEHNELNSQGRPLQDTASKIINLDVGTFMAGARKVMVPFNSCSSTEIIEIESSNENSQSSLPINGNMDIISRAIVKVERPDGNRDELTVSHENGNRLGSQDRNSPNLEVQTLELQLEEGQSKATGSPCETECPSPGQQARSDESGHGHGSSNNLGSNFGAAPMGTQPEDGESQSNENDCLKGASTTSMAMDLSHIRQAIMEMYGDITEACRYQSKFFREHSLEGVCKVVQKLLNTHFADLNTDDVDEFYSIIKDLENLKLDVKWLRQRLDKIVEAMAKRDGYYKMEEELKENRLKTKELEKALEVKTVELVQVEHAIEELEKQIALENRRAEVLDAQMNDAKSAYPCFESLMQVLL